MTPSLNELTFDLINLVRGGNTVSTEPISREQVKFWVINKRAQYIRNELNKSRSIDPYLIQDLGCVELVEVDRAECCSVEVGCTFLRTKHPIPSLVELHHKNLLTRVGPVDKISKPFDVIPYERVPYEFRNKFTRNSIKAFMMNNNGYLYLAIREGNNLAKLLDVINIQGVFENPRDVAKFSHCDGKPCYTDDSPFAIKRWMIESLKQDILKTNFNIITQAPTDGISDGKHGVLPQTNN
jgi:hypothetical protein